MSENSLFLSLILWVLCVSAKPGCCVSLIQVMQQAQLQWGIGCSSLTSLLDENTAMTWGLDMHIVSLRGRCGHPMTRLPLGCRLIPPIPRSNSLPSNPSHLNLTPKIETKTRLNG